MDRTGAAIFGASLMVAFRVLTMDEAIRSVNHETLILLTLSVGVLILD
jgi:Na+/H+ antiporter NhaD/arsenite permease-like protein